MRLDAEELSGDYVVLEALNIRYIGSNLNLAPRADISDGFLNLVLFRSANELCSAGISPISKSAKSRGRI